MRDKEEKRLAEKRKHDQVRDKVRDKEEKRLAEKRKHDQVRDKEEKRLEEKRKHDQVRDKVRDKEEPRLTEKRKHDQVRDKVRNKEDKRKAYRQSQSKLQYQKKLRSTYRTDTGFDVICSCCLQYKNATACQTINVLSANQQKKFTIRSCNLLKNRSEGFFICASCKTDIDKDKIPKRSHKDTFKYANFPTNLITKLKRTCKKSINSLSEHFKEKQELEDRKSVQMNKLESFLLKLAIPFIRIAHCPRGPYLKVKGNIILISADLSHSLSKILPHNQSYLWPSRENLHIVDLILKK